MTEQPDDPSPPPNSDDERPAASMTRRHLLGGAGLFGIGAAAGALAATAAHGPGGGHPTDDRSTAPLGPGTTRQRSGPLNVILVIRDQTRFDLPVAAGYTTPALDRLAKQGTTFRNHYVASAMCTPSRAAFFSGHPPQVNGVFDQMETGWVPNLRPDQPNMGSMMKKLGYQTAFFGKWEMDREHHSPQADRQL